VQALRKLLPGQEEGRCLGRFYWSSLLSEFLNVILPFQFVYLLLVLDRPSWAPIPLIVESAVVFAMEIPTGMIADRFGRKASTLLGDTLSAVGWLLVPLTTVTEGWTQLLVACSAFALEGLGQTMVSGAEQAWVMDNLIALGKPHLIDQYFAREKSIGSLGGVFSGVCVWLTLLSTAVGSELINALWYISAFGQLLSVGILLKVPEHTICEDEEEEGATASSPARSGAIAGFRTILGGKPLFALTLVTLIVAFSQSIADDAFQISLITKGLNPRELAPLAIAVDVIGFLAPLFAVGLARRFGAPQLMACVLLAAALAYLAFFLSPPLGVVVGLMMFTILLKDLWAPVANATLHSFIPSSNRATVGSIVNQFAELSSAAGLGAFVLLLDEHAAELQDAIPDLVEAFAGVQASHVQVPVSFFGLPVQDAALVLYTFSGLAAAAILWTYPWERAPGALPLCILEDREPTGGDGAESPPATTYGDKLET
jgi:Na+/melibiose symporter-like transporter